MPKYHFNVSRNGAHLDIDADGTDLPGFLAARRTGMSFAGETIRDAAVSGRLIDNWHMDVTDDQGLVLCRMDFIVAPSPAVERLG